MIFLTCTGKSNWGIIKWNYNNSTSWRHGTLYFWKYKIMW
jgi:hypothetical protein